MNEVENLIKFNIERYPLMEINDIIKLLYQRSFGCGHIIKNRDKAKKFLLEEFKETISDSSLPLVEEIGNGFIRVNLASYKSLGLDPENLFDAFYLSSKEKVKGVGDFLESVDVLRDLIDNGELPYSINEFDLYFNKYVDQGMPMVSHSEVYKNMYDPHYRVVSKKFFILEGDKDGKDL